MNTSWYKNKKRKHFCFRFLVRWARLELAQAYAHYPLKVACLPFHHHRVFELGLQRYNKFYYFQIFFNVFVKKVEILLKMPYCSTFE